MNRLIGVEEELLLVDADTYMPTPLSLDVVGTAAGWRRLPSGALLELEVKREQIEVVSPPLRSYGELLEALEAGRSDADAAARRFGARAVALATSPLECASHTVPSARYEKMSERFGLTMIEQLTCGFHVHVSVASAEEGVGILDRIRPWLPTVLALSANSPFWHGADSGFASYRYQAWGRWPGAGPYDVFGSVDAYAETVKRAVDTGVSLDRGMIYFDARLSAHVPTVEIRIADVCMFPRDAAALAVLVRALVETAAMEWSLGIPPVPASTGLLRLASWRASRSGISSSLLHPITGLPCPAPEVVSLTLAHAAAHFCDQEEQLLVRSAVREILRRGTGATRQRSVAAEGTLAQVVANATLRVRPTGRTPARSPSRSQS